MISSARHTSPTGIAAASLVLGPLLMSIGDLMHPQEEMDATDQAAVVVAHASWWYGAHLLLFVGFLVLVPGILALTSLTAHRKPALGYAARVLVLIGVATFSAIVASEMLIGRYVADGAAPAAAADLLATFQSGRVLGVMAAAGFAFFVGVAAFVIPLVSTAGPLRWPAAAFALGAFLVLVEIISAQVLLSQIGNLVILAASVAFAWHVVQRDQPTTATSRPRRPQVEGHT